MSLKFNDLKALSDEDLTKLYDNVAEHTVVGLNYYTEEISRRRNEKTNMIMVRLTISITVMTAVMLLSTVANVIIAVCK